MPSKRPQADLNKFQIHNFWTSVLENLNFNLINRIPNEYGTDSLKISLENAVWRLSMIGHDRLTGERRSFFASKS